MRFSTVVGADGAPPNSARQWHVSELSSPTSRTRDWDSIPVWQKEKSAERNVTRAEGRRPAIIAKLHSPELDLMPDKGGSSIAEVRLPCRSLSRDLDDVHPRNVPLRRALHRKSLSQRLLGLAMALCIAVGLLGCVMNRLSSELDKIESELEKRNEIMSGGEGLETHILPQSSLTNPSERRARRLAATTSEAVSKRNFGTHDNQGFLDTMRFHIGTIARLLKFLNYGDEYGTIAALVRTLYKLSETSILPTTKGTTDNAEFTTNSVEPENKTLPSSSNINWVQAGQAVLHNDVQRTAISLKPLQDDLTPTMASTHSHHIPKAAWTGSIFSKTVSGNPTSYNLFSSTTGNTNSLQNQALIPGHHEKTNTTRSESVHMSLTHVQKEQIPFSPDAHTDHRTDASFVPASYSAPTQVHLVEGIVLWELPRGRSLCRVFNVARLSDGTLFLPKWMEKHKEMLAAHCGLKNVMHVFGGQSKDELLKGYSSGKPRFDETFSDRDLFTPHTPRHHMPHFLSDIIPPLVATEVLLGSGREVVPFKCFSAEGKGSTSSCPSLVHDVKPFLFLDMETVSRPPTNWVPSLARFFAHPNIGFELVPDLVLDRSSEPKGLSSLTLLRSVMLTNINPYEPYGLFGSDGKNHVFTYNGISREPTWTSNGMLKRPCTVSVTVLTRQGHRALLELEELQKVIKARFVEQGLDLDFRVVDFKDTCFEDQVRTMQGTNVLIASHGAGNTNLVFMRPGGTVIEVFPFSYKAGPFDGFAKVFGMEYKTAMSAPETNVFKACMRKKEKNPAIMKEVFEKWDKAVEEDKATPWVHRLDFEKEFGEPGKSEGMTTRICARRQQLKFNIHAVAQMALDSGLGQCHFSQAILGQGVSGSSPRRVTGVSQ